MPSLTVNFDKLLKDYEKSLETMTKKLETEGFTNIESEDAKHHRTLLIDYIKDRWVKYVKPQKW